MQTTVRSHFRHTASCRHTHSTELGCFIPISGLRYRSEHGNVFPPCDCFHNSVYSSRVPSDWRYNLWFVNVHERQGYFNQQPHDGFYFASCSSILDRIGHFVRSCKWVGQSLCIPNCSCPRGKILPCDQIDPSSWKFIRALNRAMITKAPIDLIQFRRTRVSTQLMRLWDALQRDVSINF